MEKHYVYIICSSGSDKYYKGYSTDPFNRLKSHNKGESIYTSNYVPWELVYMESLENKHYPLIRERGLKKYSKQQIKDLIKSDRNEIR